VRSTAGASPVHCFQGPAAVWGQPAQLKKWSFLAQGNTAVLYHLRRRALLSPRVGFVTQVVGVVQRPEQLSHVVLV